MGQDTRVWKWEVGSLLVVYSGLMNVLLLLLVDQSSKAYQIGRAVGSFLGVLLGVVIFVWILKKARGNVHEKAKGRMIEPIGMMSPPRSKSPDVEAKAAAQIAVNTMRKAGGHALDYTPASLEHVDALLEAWRLEGMDSESARALVTALGCYVGEVIAREGRAVWMFAGDIQEGSGSGYPPNLLVIRLKNGIVANPLGKVAKRLDNGPEDSLVGFYVVVKDFVSGQAPPNAVPRS